MNACLFCEEVEHKAYSDIDYVCPKCVIMLSNASQNSLKAGLARAEEVGAVRKATAIRMFIGQNKEPTNMKRAEKKRVRGFMRRQPRLFIPGRIGLKGE